MLENILEQHVHFRRGGSSKYTQTLSQSLHTRGDRKLEGFWGGWVICTPTTVKTLDRPEPGANRPTAAGQ